MKIINFKLSISKIIIIVCILIIIALLTFAIIRFCNLVSADSDVIIMTNENYTTILKNVHDNLKDYTGKKIKMNGYVFRVNDFQGTQLVVARDMIISYPDDARIVGFLCEYDLASEYQNNIWIEVTGTITRGNYYGEIPIVKIEEIKRITTPNEIFVSPPDGFI